MMGRRSVSNNPKTTLSFAPDLTAIKPKNNPAEHLLLLCYVARRFVTSIILASLLCRNQVAFNVRDG